MTRKRWWTGLLTICCLFGCLASTGCQGYYGGQTLPSPYYIDDDVQYHPPGPEMKLSREAAAMKDYAAARGLDGQ